VIENFYRDTGFTTEVNPQDAIEWAADAFDKIGVSMSYVDKVCCVNIASHRGLLPCDIHIVMAVRDKDSKNPMVYSSDLFLQREVCDSDDASSTCVTGNCRTIEVNATPNTDPDDNTMCNPFFQFNPNPDTSSIVALNIESDMLTYSLNNDYVFTGFESGCIEIAYKAFPIDENNLPMIPDDTRIIDALVKYIIYKTVSRMAYKEDLTPQLSAKVARAEQDWFWAVGNARVSAEVPNVDKMEALKNMWLSLIPRVNEHLFSFKYMNVPEQRWVNSK